MARKQSAASLRDIKKQDGALWDHQAKSIDFFSKRPRGFDNSSPGTGKTRVQIERYANRPKPRGRLMIICPKTLMVSAWGEDIEKYAPGLTVAFATAENREAAILSDTDVLVINVDGVKWFTEKANAKIAAKALAKFDDLIIDEYTYFKHSTSQRTKALIKIRKYFKYRYGMSGTPNANTVMELFTPTLIIDDGKRLGTSYFRLRNAVQIPEQTGPMPEHVTWKDKPGATQAVSEMLGDITIRHAFAEVMKHVPPNHKHTKQFDLSKAARKAYDKMENECLLAFDDGNVNAVHAASLRTKLLQIASGAVYDENHNYKVIDPTRYELITDLVESRDHSVVFFNWTHQREQLIDMMTKRKIPLAFIDGSVSDKKRIEIVSDFQAGKYQTILLHPKTGAHGLTLTQADTTIFSSPIYEADMMEQGLARIYRGTQDKVTNTIFIQAKNTVEAVVYGKLFDKSFNMNDLLEQMANRHK